MKKTSKQKAILCDIDGTICDDTYRHKYADENGKTNWDKYFKKDLILNEKINTHLKNRLLSYKKDGYKIIFLTGRQKNLQETTMQFLRMNKLPVDGLFMRKIKSDYMDIVDFKFKEIKKLKKIYNFEIAFDDLDEGIEALKMNKIPYEQITFKRS